MKKLVFFAALAMLLPACSKDDPSDPPIVKVPMEAVDLGNLWND